VVRVPEVRLALREDSANDWIDAIVSPDMCDGVTDVRIPSESAPNYWWNTSAGRCTTKDCTRATPSHNLPAVDATARACDLCGSTIATRADLVAAAPDVLGQPELYGTDFSKDMAIGNREESSVVKGTSSPCWMSGSSRYRSVPNARTPLFGISLQVIARAGGGGASDSFWGLMLTSSISAGHSTSQLHQATWLSCECFLRGDSSTINFLGK
jgi:hypothetical protein